jgi:hypothetical protein
LLADEVLRYLHDVCTPFVMRTITLPLPAFGFILATRAALAAGLGLLLADRVPRDRRRTVGLSLVAFGAAATIPAARWISRGFHPPSARTRIDADTRLIGTTRFPRRGDHEL